MTFSELILHCLSYGYLPAYVHFKDNVKIVHFIGALLSNFLAGTHLYAIGERKPWDGPPDAGGKLPLPFTCKGK